MAEDLIEVSNKSYKVAARYNEVYVWNYPKSGGGRWRGILLVLWLGCFVTPSIVNSEQNICDNYYTGFFFFEGEAGKMQLRKQVASL
ncbi:hypothetical protein J6590_102938 [Homalodisca vitripennis]|nr:hypothetical protein J6590_102938 [Homalodisca vitripennis]